MTTILALDSSSDACSVALLHHGTLFTQFELAAKSHTQRLLPMVDEMLSVHGVALSQVDAIAFGRGPGSFTGLRICMGVVQGLAFGADRPVIPVSTLHAIAHEFAQANPDNNLPIAVALDARMQEVYWGVYSQSGDVLEPETVIKPAELLIQSSLLSQAVPCVGLGQGWSYPELAAVSVNEKQLDVYASAGAMATLAERVWSAGGAIPIEQAEPVYLRDSVTWQKRERIRKEAL